MDKQIANWRKSTFSSGNGGACIEVATADTVLIRDTTNREGFTLAMSPGAWTAFLTSLR
jgi:Domain of unknown function (DUF397)